MLLKSVALPLAGLLLGFSFAWSAAPPKKKPTAKAPAAKSTVVRKPSTSKSTASSRARYTQAKRASSYSRGRTRGRSPQPVAARRYSGQQGPTQERYLEIQQALATRGFLQSTPSGAWDAPTVDALKRFQEEQNLPATGKITSLSLIALGLGPKRNPLTATAAPQPPQ